MSRFGYMCKLENSFYETLLLDFQHILILEHVKLMICNIIIISV